jgi:CubicO group peptidase (beta-lactamase class C family)
MLAEHRAGTTDIFNDRYQRMDRSTLRHNHDYVALFRDEPLWFAPGTSQRYSNAGYVLLGEVVGKASGGDYYDYVRRHVCEPAGMTDTDWYEADDPTPNLAMGYYRDSAGVLRENVFTRPARGSAAGGGYSTADDLLRFEQALRGAKLAGPAWSRWVLGGPPPGPRAATGPLPDAYAFAGGSVGISASVAHHGEWTLIVLGNLDRGIMGKVESQLQQWLEVVKD